MNEKCWRVDWNKGLSHIRCARPRADHGPDGLKHAFTKERPDNWRQFCANCYTYMDVDQPFFICAACLRQLPPDIRRKVMSSDDVDEARHARMDALSYLGSPDSNDIRMPNKRRPRRDTCSHDPTHLRDQPNMITGATDKVCNKCGHVRYADAKTREVIV